MSIGNNDIAVRGHGAGGRADKSVFSCFGDPRSSQTHQEITVLIKLVNLETPALGGWVVAERTAVTGPQITVMVHTEAVGLHNQPGTEALFEFPISIDIVDGWVGAE